MKFKNKIIISFCIIIFVPIFLATLVLFSMQHIQMRAIEQTYGVEGDGYSYFSNSVQLLSRFTREIYREVYKVADNQPEKLEDGAYLEKINQQLEEKASYLIVRKGQELVYIGKSAGTSLLTELPEYGSADGNADSGTYMDGEEQALVKQIDFVYPDGAKGSIFIVTRLEEMVPELKSLLIDIMVSIVLILVLTACMLTVWIYTSLINPIKKLQAAAQNIKEGNLDFTIEAESRDEIGELCTSFEEMRQRLKDNAEEKINSEKENKMLISNIAHDLKTPITAVKGYAEGLMDGVADTPEKRDKYIRTIYNKANEMDTLINELTLYAKIDTNRIPYNFAKINVGEYFNDCIEEIGLDLESKNIGLAYFNYTDGSTQIIADPEQLRRVIHNIIGNSIKYLDKQRGLINIRIKDVGDFIQIEIEDNGKGIAAKDLPNIFDRFYRTDSSRNSSKGGSGIGHKRNAMRRALVVGAERLSRITDWTDRATCVLFGDGAGAVVLEWDESAPGILASFLKNTDDDTLCLTVDANHDMSTFPFGENVGNVGVGEIMDIETDEGGFAEHAAFIRMHGQRVFKFATAAIVEAAREVCERAGVSMDEVSCIVPHQANDRIIRFAAKKLGVPYERWQVSIAEAGNTSASSVLMALSDAYEEGRIKPGDKVMCVGFGGGLTSGAMLFEA